MWIYSIRIKLGVIVTLNHYLTTLKRVLTLHQADSSIVAY